MAKAIFLLAAVCIIADHVGADPYPLDKKFILLDQTVVDPDDHFGARCGDGSEFTFAALRGTTNNLVIEFEGGGACFSEETCSALNGQTCRTRRIVDNFGEESSYRVGNFPDHSAEKNPIKEWNHIYIPYCTCDLHMGNSSLPESGHLFYGSRNVDLAIDWVLKNYKEKFNQTTMPDKILSAGCSAGGYGAAINYVKIYDKFGYYSPKIYHFSDASNGLFSTAFVGDALAGYGRSGFDSIINDTLRNSALDTIDKLISDAPTYGKYGIIAPVLDYMASELPDVDFVFFSHEKDWNQELFHTVSYIQAGVDVIPAFDDALLDMVQHLQGRHDNFKSWVVEGTPHCAITSDLWQKTKMKNSFGVPITISEAIADMLNGGCVYHYASEGKFNVTDIFPRNCVTSSPTTAPTTGSPTLSPITIQPTESPSLSPTISTTSTVTISSVLVVVVGFITVFLFIGSE